MSFWTSLIAARGHLVYVTALLASSYVILSIEDQLGETAPPPKPAAVAPVRPPPRPVSSGVFLDLGLTTTPIEAAALLEQARVEATELIGRPAVLRDQDNAISLVVGPFTDRDMAKNVCERLLRASFKCQIRSTAS